MSTACTASLSGVRAPAVPRGRGSARVARATAVTAKATGGVAEVEKQQEQHPIFANLRRSAAAAAAAAVIVAGAPDAALATEYERGVPPAPSNGPLRNLPRELTEPDEIFREDFTVKFAGFEAGDGGGEALETINGNNRRSIQGGAALNFWGKKVDVPVVKVDHKYLVGSLIVGQGIGFLGSVIGGNEARKKAGGTRQPVAPYVSRRDIRA